jgi:hypothetical protein
VSLRIQLEAKAADQTPVVVPIHLQALQVCSNIYNYADQLEYAFVNAPYLLIHNEKGVSLLNFP